MERNEKCIKDNLQGIREGTQQSENRFQDLRNETKTRPVEKGCLLK